MDPFKESQGLNSRISLPASRNLGFYRYYFLGVGKLDRLQIEIFSSAPYGINFLENEKTRGKERKRKRIGQPGGAFQRAEKGVFVCGTLTSVPCIEYSVSEVKE